MKALFLSLTLLGLSTVNIQQLNAEEKMSNRKLAELIQDSANLSANKYCSEKDKGTSEQKSLNKAYYAFVSNVADEANTTPIVIHESLNKEALDHFWSSFNTFAFEICPKYY